MRFGPERAGSTWANFLRSQADALLACDFLETITLSRARMYVLAVIEHRTRRIRVLGAAAHTTASWVVQAARNLVMDLEHAGCRTRFPIRDRDGKFPGLFDTVLADAGVKVVLTGVRMPRMNALMERWIVRHEALVVRMEVRDRPFLCRRSGGVKLAGSAGRRGRWEQPRQNRVVLVLPNGAGAVSEAGSIRKKPVLLRLFTFRQL